MMPDAPCTCGHAIDEHGDDTDYPGSTACQICDCIAYEPDDSKEVLQC